MIRLGSLAGYPFEGPRVLAGWTAPAVPAVYAVVTRNDAEAKPQEFSVIYIGHSAASWTRAFAAEVFRINIGFFIDPKSI